LTITLPLRYGEVTRSQCVDSWLTPGNRSWTIVGLAAGKVGFNLLQRNLKALDNQRDTTMTAGRIALYAKGCVRGKWLLTLAFDTAKRGRTARFGGVIDPGTYYTVYADRSERRYDAQSLRKLYLRIERPQFHALFGDFDTAIAEPQLTRYVPALNGVKAQYQSAQVAATAFAADTPFTHHHDVALRARWALSATLDLGVAASVRQGLAAGPRACPVGR
jgi:hypothetical protein